MVSPNYKIKADGIYRKFVALLRTGKTLMLLSLPVFPFAVYLEFSFASFAVRPFGPRSFPDVAQGRLRILVLMRRLRGAGHSVDKHALRVWRVR